MQQAVEQALAVLPVAPAELMVSPSGGMLDDREVPPKARQGIYAAMAKSTADLLLIETRSETATERHLDEYRATFPHRSLAIEFGLESASSWISTFCVNKGAEPDRFAAAAAAAHRREIGVYANVCIGTAFLSARESVEDAVQTARWAFAHGGERVVLFPLHIKRFTLLEVLHHAGLYPRVSLWSLVECLRRLGSENSHRVEIAWYKSYYTQKSKMTFSPTTCDICLPTVLTLMDTYRQTQDFAVIEKLAAFSCACHEEWRAAIEAEPSSSLPERVLRSYEFLDDHLGVGARDELASVSRRLFVEEPFTYATWKAHDLA
ncbi:hypothetical protein [Chthoniobacter flavus]|nr:hypothetical protein [Chthoniobacter flavus]